jgi:hypothetical protein
MTPAESLIPLNEIFGGALSQLTGRYPYRGGFCDLPDPVTHNEKFPSCKNSLTKNDTWC